MCFIYAKVSDPKVIKGFVLASDISVSDQKLTQNNYMEGLGSATI